MNLIKKYRLHWLLRKDAFKRIIWPLQFHKSQTFDSPQELSEFLSLALSLNGGEKQWGALIPKLAADAKAFCENGREFAEQNKDGYYNIENDKVLQRHEAPFYKIEIIYIPKK